MSSLIDPKTDKPTVVAVPLRQHRTAQVRNGRPRASTTDIVSLPRLSLTTDPAVTNSPATPRNKLAAVIHLERLDAIPRSPRTALLTSSTSTTISSPAIDPQDTAATTTVQHSTNSSSKQRELFKPPLELPEEIRKTYAATLVSERSRRRQERAAKEIQAVMQRKGSNSLPLSSLANTSSVNGVTKVVSYNVDRIDSDSDSDELKSAETCFYPFEAARDSSGSSNATSPRKSSHGDATRAQRHSMEIEATEDINDSDDDDKIDDCEQTAATNSDHQRNAVAASTDAAANYAQAMGERIREKNNFVIMQSVLTGKSCCYDFLKVYDTIWYGLKPVVREQFWMSQIATHVAGATEDVELPSFEQLIANGQITRLCYDEIIKDIYRAYPFITQSRPDIDRQIYRALVAYAIYRPDIGYVQSMTHLYMTILLVLPRQSQQLRMMEHLTRRVLPFYYDTDLIGVRIDGAVLAAYMHQRCQKLTEFYEARFAATIETLTLQMALVWFTKLFVQVLQGSQLMRIWDMIMLRGPVTLIQFSLQILSYAYKRELFLEQDNYTHFITTMTKHLRSLVSIDSILKTRLHDKHIPIEDFELRRRAATRIQLEALTSRQNDTCTTDVK